MLHPVTLLLLWVGFAGTLQLAPFALLVVLLAISIVLAGVMAAERSRRLVWRSRWLLLSLTILFLFFTPGEYLPDTFGRLGLTYEGVGRTGEQISRLLVVLLSLAILHESLGTQGLMAGLYRLMGPFPWRETTVVRLMLVLEMAEQKQQIKWREWLMPVPQFDVREPEVCRLLTPALRMRDRVVIACLLTLIALFLLV